MNLITTLRELIVKMIAIDYKMLIRITTTGDRHLSSNGLATKASVCSYRSTHSMLFWLIIVIILSNCDKTILAQCPVGTTMSFEKISSVTVRGVPLYPLYSGPADIPVTAECNNRCRAGPKCRAFLINYDKHMCTGMDYDSLNRGASIVSTSDRTSYFEKICLSAAPCEKAWTFERVMGRELGGFDDKILNGVASRLRCQELCLKERSFVCRSGEYDYALQQCRLSSEDRRSQSTAYRVSAASVDYFENECAAPVNGPPGCDFEKYDNSDIKRADLVRTAFTVDQCRSLCDATRAFVCRSFTYAQQSAQCWLSSDDALAIGGVRALETQTGAVYHQRSHCLDLQLFCNHDSMTVSLNTADPFNGKLYAKEEPIGCESTGRSTTNTLLTMPFSPRTECGIREDNGKYSSLVVIQHHPLIQRKGDRMVQLTCHFETINKTITNSYSVVVETPAVAETAIVNATAPSPNIRLRITDAQGVDITGARLGDELYLRIELDDDSVFGIFARDLLAKSGKTDETIVLIDSNGCPVDTNIFPALAKVANSKALQGKFDAFKFADDVVVRFQVNVQFCLQDCAPTDCTDNSSYPSVSADANRDGVSTGGTGTKSYGRRRKRDASEYVTEKDTLGSGRQRTNTNNNSGDNNNHHRKKSTTSTTTTTTTPATLLPDYPLQREIIVEGISTAAKSSSRQPSIRALNDVDNMSLFCTSRTTLMAGLVTIVTLQLTIIGSCCACLLIYKRSYYCCFPSESSLFCGDTNHRNKDQESITTTISTREHSPNLYNFRSVSGRQSSPALWSHMARIE